MKEFSKNPRNISEFEIYRLKKNIEELGDLGGITHDLEIDEIITGNQRVKTLNLDKCEIKLTEEFKEPNSQGTVAYGFIITPDGTQLNYRQVRWNDEQRDKANITSNKLGGEWDFAGLIENFDKNILLESGFDDDELILPEVDDDELKKDTSAKTKKTKYFRLEILFENKNDYTAVIEIIDKSKQQDETIADTLKRLLINSK